MFDDSEVACQIQFEISYDSRDGGTVVRMTPAAPVAPEPVQAPGSYSFAELCVPLRAELLCYAANLTRNDMAFAEDVIQVAYEQALRNWSTWSPTHGLPEIDARGWMYRIVCHAFTQHYRTLTRRSKLLKRATQDPTLALNRGHGRDVHDSENYSDEMFHALSNLSPERQIVVQLCDVEEKSAHDVAKMLGIPEGTVNSRLNRAHEDMRKSLRVAKAAPAVMRRRRAVK